MSNKNYEGIQKSLNDKMDKSFWEGFDLAIEMVLNHLDNTEYLTSEATLLKDDIIEEAELYKKNG